MSEKPRVLVVDDDRAIRVLVARIVERAGFPVDTASDGAEAIEKIRSTRYAVCVIDLMMPNVNGYEIVEFIGKHCAVGDRPAVIVITAVAESSAIVRLDGRIVHSIVRKPFDISVLAELITATATMATEQSSEGKDEGDATVLPFPHTR
jgi:DNA-binding response OmpR family regulator